MAFQRRGGARSTAKKTIMRNHITVLAVCVLCAIASPTAAGAQDTVTVDTTSEHRVQTLRPQLAIGSTVDKEPAGSIPALYSKANVNAMLAAGLGWLSYRLFTELSDQDWHWNPVGTFSDGQHGYWTSSASTDTPAISDSFGYRLPHRGNTTDQGNNEDYSRLDDGDLQSYWKSDPYLTSAFTGESDALHPQWVVVDLGSAQPVDAIRIDWANPYATQYTLGYFTGSDAIGDPTNGKWKAFPRGAVVSGRGGNVTLRISPSPVKTQFIRIWMTQSSNTCDPHGGSDRRNCVGYAIEELSIGTLGSGGAFHDLIRHVPCPGIESGPYACSGKQTATYTSSTDPWHASAGRVINQEQPGLDLIARSGLTRALPAMYPVAMLYSTPENAAAEVRYLEARGYPILGIELGEETDGQYTQPEDYAALYLQWASALHAVDPKLLLGGPIFSGVNSDLQWWPDAHGNVSWLARFVNYLRSHGRMNDLAFMSFEHYPFDGCEHGDKLQHDLLVEPSIVKTVVDAWHADGIPSSLPLYITEAGFSSSNFSQTPMQIEGALWLADYMGSALANGVNGVVYYQYEPVPLSQNKQCPTDWGNLSMFASDKDANIRARTAQFFAAQMLTQQWLAPGTDPHELYPAYTNVLQGGLPLVTAYVAKRPDGTWSLMMVNKDAQPHDVSVRFSEAQAHDGMMQPADRALAQVFTGDVTRVTFGSAQYAWQSNGALTVPMPNDPPAVTVLHATDSATYTVPARSITVLRGAIGAMKGSSP
jgi:hypothetical protein